MVWVGWIIMSSLVTLVALVVVTVRVARDRRKKFVDEVSFGGKAVH